MKKDKSCLWGILLEMMIVTLDGFVTCPCCSSQVRVGRFYESEPPSLEQWVQQPKQYYEVDIFRVECQECGAQFNTSALYGATLWFVEP